MLKVLSLFDCSNKIRDSFRSLGCKAHSLDINPGYNNSKVDICVNILDFNYQAYNKEDYNFLFIALPCQCYSIASGSFHYKNSLPVTSRSIQHINILIKVYQIINYFKASFVIENPSGGLVNNVFFKSFFNVQLTRITLGSFGFPTQKKTDLFHNFNLLFISNPIVRVNGNYSKQSLDNLTYRKRVTYPDAFVVQITQAIFNHFSNL